MSKQKLNIELLRKVRDRIRDIPESYDQTHWAAPSETSPCGTTACIAGETIICAATTVKDGIAKLNRLQNGRHESIPTAAAKLLGLPDPKWEFQGGRNETAILFDSVLDDDDVLTVAWPKQFKARYDRARTVRGRARAAAAYLDHIIETGKVLE